MVANCLSMGIKGVTAENNRLASFFASRVDFFVSTSFTHRENHEANAKILLLRRLVPQRVNHI